MHLLSLSTALALTTLHDRLVLPNYLMHTLGKLEIFAVAVLSRNFNPRIILVVHCIHTTVEIFDRENMQSYSTL